MGRIIAIANQKGGVGKTTTAVNLAACLTALEHDTLLIDLDPQGNATQGCGVDKNEISASLYDIMIDDMPVDEALVETSMDGLLLIPSNRDLVGAEVELVEAERREFKLRDQIYPIRDAFEYIIIDCPPSLSLLTLNGLVAADDVIITLQCEYFALEGLSELLNTIILVRDTLNPDLQVNGVLLTMFQHTNLSRQVVEDVRNHLGDKVFETVIPRNVTLGEAPSYGMPIIMYDIKSAGALAYQTLAKELISRG